MRHDCERVLSLTAWILLLPAFLLAEEADQRATTITADTIRQHVQVLASDTFEGREAGTRGGRAASIYLRQSLEKSGLGGGAANGSFFQEFGYEYRNVLAWLPGSDPQLAHEVIVVGAHYDHVGYGSRATSNGPIGYIHNGADDNASGTATLLEVAKSLAQRKAPLPRSILFAFWDAEEKGLLGSRHWIAHPTVSLDRVRLMVNLDMVGRLRENRLQVFGSRTAPGLRRILSRNNRDTDLLFDFTRELPDNSDHYPFLERRIPIVMPFTGYHDEYHRPSDDVHTLNFEGTARITRWLVATLQDLAELPELPPFREACFQEAAQSQPPAIAEVPSRSRLGISWDRQDLAPGRLITRVAPGSPAESAGLRVGDRLLKFGDIELDETIDLRTLILAAPVEIALTVQPADTSDEPVVRTVRLAGGPVRLGVHWLEDAAEPGTLILDRVDPGLPAALAGLKVGDRVHTVNGERFADGHAFREQTLSVHERLSLSIEREGRMREVELLFTDGAVVQSTPREITSE